MSLSPVGKTVWQGSNERVQGIGKLGGVQSVPGLGERLHRREWELCVYPDGWRGFPSVGEEGKRRERACESESICVEQCLQRRVLYCPEKTVQKELASTHNLQRSKLKLVNRHAESTACVALAQCMAAGWPGLVHSSA
eukprot:219499-Rhodomonas_salina.2